MYFVTKGVTSDENCYAVLATKTTYAWYSVLVSSWTGAFELNVESESRKEPHT